MSKLHLLKFEITKFQTFWDSFESVVHLNPNLSLIDMFNYLKALIQGPAASTVLRLTLTEANYSAVVELLKGTIWEETTSNLCRHGEELLKLPSHTDDKAVQTRSIYDQVSVNIRGLEASGVEHRQYGSLLIPITMTKLPPNIRLQMAH